MAVKNHGLVAGKVHPRHFVYLLAGTSIRSKSLRKALFEYFVNGMKKADAADKHHAFRSNLCSAVETIEKESARTLKMMPFYRNQNTSA